MHHTLPKVVTGGFPNSGTSFLTRLVVQLGFSPGPQRGLKRADAHNRYGYFEYLPLRNAIYEELGLGPFNENNEMAYRDLDLSQHPLLPSKIMDMVGHDQVEVFKDNSLPYTCLLYPPSTKFLVVKRDVNAIYKSPQKGGNPGFTCSLEKLDKMHERYYEKLTNAGVDMLIVQYEDFFDDFNSVFSMICSHCGVIPTHDLQESCRNIFQPRSSQNRLTRLLNGIKICTKMIIRKIQN